MPSLQVRFSTCWCGECVCLCVHACFCACGRHALAPQPGVPAFTLSLSLPTTPPIPAHAACVTPNVAEMLESCLALKLPAQVEVRALLCAPWCWPLQEPPLNATLFYAACSPSCSVDWPVQCTHGIPCPPPPLLPGWARSSPCLPKAHHIACGHGAPRRRSTTLEPGGSAGGCESR